MTVCRDKLVAVYINLETDQFYNIFEFLYADCLIPSKNSNLRMRNWSLNPNLISHPAGWLKRISEKSEKAKFFAVNFEKTSIFVLLQ